MRCRKCGSLLEDGDTVCRWCGAVVEPPAPVPSPPPAPEKPEKPVKRERPAKVHRGPGCLSFLLASVLIFVLCCVFPEHSALILLGGGFVLLLMAANRSSVDTVQRFVPSTSDRRRAGLEYEHFCARYLLAQGFRQVKVTPPSGDFGADIVGVGPQGDKWVFQCKYYQSKIGNSPIQEIVAARPHYGAAKAGVVTNSRFTDKARQLVRENGVTLCENVTSYRTGKQETPYSVEEMMFYDEL